MADDLFRRDALVAQSGERWGQPVGLIPTAWSRITLLLTLLVTATLFFICMASFSRKETVLGRLVPATSEARVFAAEAGTVMKLRVSLGSAVAVGDILVEIGTVHQIDNDSSLGTKNLDSLAAEMGTLKDQRANALQTAVLAHQRNDIDIESAKSTQRNLAADADLTHRRIAIAADRMSSYEKLRIEGAASLEEQRVSEDTLLAQQQQLANILSQIDEAAQKERSLYVDRNRIDRDLEKELADLDNRVFQTDALVARARADAGFVIKAAVPGRIAALQIAEGQRVDPSRPLMTIVPNGGRVVAEVYVPSRAIGFIEPGQAVRLQYDAFPYQKFGTAGGHVLAVSKTTLTPQELTAPIHLEEPVYQVFIALDAQAMRAFGRDVPLQSGMQLSADIVLEKRQLVEWLLEPLTAAAGRLRDSS